MIIGNGNNNFSNQNTNFQNKFNTIKQANNQTSNDPYNSNMNRNHYTDVSNKDAMFEKSFQMLQERLDQGLISLDDFHKQCSRLNKLRQK